MAELVRVLNDEGAPTGEYLPKDEILERGLWRPVVHLWLVNDRAETIIATRTMTIQRWPGLKDVAVGEGVQHDEEYLHAAIRGAKEELDLQLDEEDLIHLGEYKMNHDLPSGNTTNEYDHTFGVVWNGDLSDLVVDGRELESVDWVPLKELEAQVSDPDQYTSYIDHSQEYFHGVIGRIMREIIKA